MYEFFVDRIKHYRDDNGDKVEARPRLHAEETLPLANWIARIRKREIARVKIAALLREHLIERVKVDDVTDGIAPDDLNESSEM